MSDTICSRLVGSLPACCRAVLVPTAAFQANKRGYPALPRRHQEFLADCFRLGVQVVLTGAAQHTPPPPPPGNAVAVGPDGGAAPAAAVQHPLRLYWEYLSYLFRWASCCRG
jgi:protein arginine N-methyltransferase 5